MKLAYMAYDGTGNMRRGTVEGPDVLIATEMLRRQGLFVAEVKEMGHALASSNRRWKPRFGSGRRLSNLVVFTRQLSVLLASGTPLVQGLTALERQTRSGPWRETIQALRLAVEQGMSLSEAMEARSEYFDAIYRTLVAAGESSGHFVEMLDSLVSLKQRELRIRRSIVGALTYPALLAGLCLAVFLVLLIFVVPRFAMLFASLDVPLPASTQVLVTASTLLRHYWWLWMSVVVFAVAGSLAYTRTPAGKRLRDTLVLRLPYIGAITKNFATARIVRLLGVLLAAHVPVLTALRLVRHAVANGHYVQLITQAETQVEKGDSIALAFANHALVSPSVQEAIRSGEQSGRLEGLLNDIAGFLDDDNEVVVRSMTTILEPVILTCMGVLVAIVAISMFLPLFDLTAMAQTGGA